MEGQVKAVSHLALKEWSVVVRVLHEGSGILTINERQKYEDGDRFQALPEEIGTGGAAPALSAEVFGHRLAVVRRALGDAADG